MGVVNASALNSLQTRINAERTRRSLSPVTFTDGTHSAGDIIKATHFSELRSYTEGLNTLGSQTFNWSGNISVGANITDVLTQIGNFVTTLENETLASWKSLPIASSGSYDRNGAPVYFEVYTTTASMRSNNQFRFIVKDTINQVTPAAQTGGNIWVALTTFSAVNWPAPDAMGGGTGYYGQWRANWESSAWNDPFSQIQWIDSVNQPYGNPDFDYFNNEQDVYQSVDTKNDGQVDQAYADEGGSVFTAGTVPAGPAIVIPAGTIVPSNGDFSTHNHIVASSNFWGTLPTSSVPSYFVDIQAYY